MKKTFLSVCIGVAIMATSCSNDPAEHISGQNQSGEEQAIATGDGVYNPAAKIVSSVNNGITDTWEWNCNRLRSITSQTDEEQAFTTSFNYNYEGRITSIINSPIYDFSQNIQYRFSDSKLTSILVQVGEASPIECGLTRSSDGHVASIAVEMNDELAEVIGEIVRSLFDSDDESGFFDFFMAHTNNGRNLGINEGSIAYALKWSNDNVTSITNSMSIRFELTINEIRQTPMFTDLLGNYAPMLNMIPGSTPVPISLAFTERSTYTYDDHPNPLCGLWRDVTPEALSANNVISSHTTSSSNLTFSIAGMQLPSYDLPGDDDHDEVRTYTYNEAGFPTKVYRDGKLSISYTYNQ